MYYVLRYDIQNQGFVVIGAYATQEEAFANSAASDQIEHRIGTMSTILQQGSTVEIV